MLAAEGVCAALRTHVALAPPDLEVAPGETVALIGPNGAGKSTLLAILAGALDADRGRVASPLPPGAIGWAPQRPAQYARLSARENLALFARLRADSPTRQPRRTACSQRSSCRVDDRPAGELSVGNQQRLNLAIALLGDPSVLLLDEPTASLDPAAAARLGAGRVGRARTAARRVFATQNLEEARALADRSLALEDGRHRVRRRARGVREPVKPRVA